MKQRTMNTRQVNLNLKIMYLCIKSQDYFLVSNSKFHMISLTSLLVCHYFIRHYIIRSCHLNIEVLESIEVSIDSKLNAFSACHLHLFL